MIGSKYAYYEMFVDYDHPAAHFKYTYNFDFGTLAAAYVKKHDYEPKMNLTTISNVQQVDDDKFCFYRRYDTVETPGDEFTYDKVCFNRADKTITSELMAPALDRSERVYERSILKEEEDGRVSHNHELFIDQGLKTFKIEQFRLAVGNLIKAVKFHKFEQQQ